MPSLIEIGLLVLKKIFKKISVYFYSFVIISLLGKGVVLHLYNSESTSPKDALYQVWLKLAQ